MSVPTEVRGLIDRFSEQKEAYRHASYNETQVRREFIDPLFKALGWDIDNTKGKPEQYKDVIHEDAIKIGGKTKAPDYCFRVGGDRKFFVEAKKPAVPLASHKDSAFQLKRYAWSANLPLGILTDFEEIVVYDCRKRPVAGEAVTKARLHYFRFDELPERWKEFSGLFSRSAVENGSLDGLLDRKTRGSATVDKEFLKEIERWRGLLAKNIAVRNKKLTTEELNRSVQGTIDRLIFLRICEDRGIESYERLKRAATGPKVYGKLVDLFRYADKRFNSGLFHFDDERGQATPPDTLSLSLSIDDEPLQDIIRHLYYPESPYEFSVLPTEILGHVYEQFLGKVIRLTADHHAKIEEKPEVRKAGGVYYTPRYIVDYIVEHTVGELVKGKRPAQVAKLKVLDPACGSGSFLLGAYQYLLDWHRDWYVDDDPKKHARGKNPKLYRAAGEEWRLTAPEKRRILLNNIHGVDIDAQAVEVTKLSLLLKVLEDVSGDALQQQFGVLQERALPDLGNNVKCGNSLIGHDYFEGELLPDEEELKRINPFDWEDEFSEIMRGGGFDAVIGNPPYLPIFELDKTQLDFLSRKFRFYQKRYDGYALFLEKVTEILRDKGVLGYIIPSSLLNNLAYTKLREHLAKTTNLIEVRTLGGNVFQGVNKDTMTLILEKGHQGKNFSFEKFIATNVNWGEELEKQILLQETAMTGDSFTTGSQTEEKLVSKLFTNDLLVPLTTFCKTYQGIVTGSDEVFLISRNESLQINSHEQPFLKDFLLGRDIGRYSTPLSKQKIIYLTRKDSLSGKPNFHKRLSTQRSKLSERRESKKGLLPWFALHWPRDRNIFEQPKILVQGIRNLSLPRRIVATLDTSGAYAGVNLSIINMREDSPYDLQFILAILNSRLVNFIFTHKYIDHRIKNRYLDSVPIRKMNFDQKRESNSYKTLLELVNRRIQLSKQGKSTQTARSIQATERQLDQLIYDLYGLTNAEIKTVEEASA